MFRSLPRPLPLPPTSLTSIRVSVPASPGPLAAGTAAEDGLIDLIAIRIAMRGERPVTLTTLERLIAVAQILNAGGRPHDVAARLRVSIGVAEKITRRVRRPSRALRAVLDTADAALRGTPIKTGCIGGYDLPEAA
jgi:hypothetical protein